MKVLNLVGLADSVKDESTPLQEFQDTLETGEMLGRSDLPSTFTDNYYQPAAGIRQTSINLMLKKNIVDLGVEIREGWELVDIQESNDSVTSFFNGGRSVTGPF